MLIKLVDTFDAPRHGPAGKARQRDREEGNGGPVSLTHVRRETHPLMTLAAYVRNPCLWRDGQSAPKTP